MPTPLLFIALPLLVAPLVYALRLRGWFMIEAAVAAIVAGLLAVLAAFLPLEAAPLLRNSFNVLGRQFVVELVDRGALTLIFIHAALIFCGAAMQTQGRYFSSAGLAGLGLLAGALFVRPFLYAAIFLELAAALTVFMLADARHPKTGGALRFLTYTTLGMPFILFTGWLLEASAASPNDPRFLIQAAATLGAGFAILMGVVPFHSWVPMVAEFSPPLATTYVAVVMRAPIVFLLLRFLQTYDWLGGDPATYRALVLAGVGMVVVGALFVFGQRNLGRSVGYALIIEFGAIFLAIGLGTRAGVEATLAMLAMRGLGLWLWAIGLEALRRAARASGAAEGTSGGDSFEALRGLGWRHPFAVTAAAVGLLSVMGLPLMAGFAPRWALFRLLAEQSPALALTLLAAMTSVGVVVMRGLAAMTTPRSPDEVIRPQESRAARVVFVVGVSAVLLLGAFPQWLLPLAVGAAQYFTRFGP